MLIEDKEEEEEEDEEVLQRHRSSGDDWEVSVYFHRREDLLTQKI